MDWNVSLCSGRECECECVFIYRTYHIVSLGGLQFYLSEIGRQLAEAPLCTGEHPNFLTEGGLEHLCHGATR